MNRLTNTSKQTVRFLDEITRKCSIQELEREIDAWYHALIQTVLKP